MNGIVILNLNRIKGVVKQLSQTQTTFIKSVANQRKVFLLVGIAQAFVLLNATIDFLCMSPNPMPSKSTSAWSRTNV